jgi:uncharacterized repeat protein (TIGR04076 family)
MAKRSDVKVKVIEQVGHCGAGHKVGDEWTITNLIPGGICVTAMAGILPDVRALMYGGSFPWGSDEDSSTFVCPDPHNRVLFEVRRVKR